MIYYVSSCITADAQKGWELHPHFSQKSEKKKYCLEDLVLGAAGKRLIKIDLRETICEDWICLAEVRIKVWLCNLKFSQWGNAVELFGLPATSGTWKVNKCFENHICPYQWKVTTEDRDGSWNAVCSLFHYLIWLVA